VNKRLQSCLRKLRDEDLDGFLVSSSTNISYLTDFREAEGYLLLARDKIHFFTNFIYQYEAASLTEKNIAVTIYKGNLFETITRQCKKYALHQIGFEPKRLPQAEYKEFDTCFARRGVNFKPITDFIEELRTVKEKREIERIRRAHAISLEAFEFAREIIDSNSSEKDLCIEIERFLKLKGDLDIAFSPIVAFGANSSCPHHIPSDSPLAKNKIVLIDLGAKAYGYCADLTRVLFLDRIPLSVQKIYDTVRKAQGLAIAKIRDGAVIKDIDGAARSYIEEKGYGNFFGHGLGHGVGLNVHELPFINSKNPEVLRENMIVTVEPAIYLPGRFGIRLEEMVLVGRKKAEVLAQ